MRKDAPDIRWMSRAKNKMKQGETFRKCSECGMPTDNPWTAHCSDYCRKKSLQRTAPKCERCGGKLLCLVNPVRTECVNKNCK